MYIYIHIYIFTCFLILVNSLKKLQVGNKQKSRSVRHGNSRVRKEYARYDVLGVRKEKRLIMHKST